ncbi:Preprotein translocase secY subunit (TC 3.A.5.1.1) [Crocosphaera watsonii WH 0402]|uniref:Preprotein translocase secY subunit (TC 3.A.5.1.1) n=1 Tax=Crocosphaera watsonii WH 0402 TaxID=1284629 RepID=T2JIQ2_CROWT|nr:hypothetical protein [Crocosphaera watsonii]CCQ65155.1 Preprotein translocase secY subunit (TC 3.A.5.1.1) [Crocosphaera watsonii WH 0402]
MVVSREKTPTAQETFLQMAQAAGLRGRLLITIGLLIFNSFWDFYSYSRHRSHRIC